MHTQQRQRLRSIRSDLVAHRRVESIVHVRQRQIKPWFRLANIFDLRDPFRLLLARQIRAKIQNFASESRDFGPYRGEPGEKTSTGSNPADF